MFNVPGTKPGPVAVQVIVAAGIVRTPERRSSLANTDSRMVAFSGVRAFTVMLSGPDVGATCGTRLGLLSGNVTALADKDIRASPLMETVTVAVRVCAEETAGRTRMAPRTTTFNVPLTALRHQSDIVFRAWVRLEERVASGGRSPRTSVVNEN